MVCAWLGGAPAHRGTSTLCACCKEDGNSHAKHRALCDTRKVQPGSPEVDLTLTSVRFNVAAAGGDGRGVDPARARRPAAAQLAARARCARAGAARGTTRQLIDLNDHAEPRARTRSARLGLGGGSVFLGQGPRHTGELAGSCHADPIGSCAAAALSAHASRGTGLPSRAD